MTWSDKFKVDLPDGKNGKWEISHFTIDHSKQDWQLFMEEMRGRGLPDGTYTRLSRNGAVVMSDTLAEVNDHYKILNQVEHADGGSVLIHGLGLGMVLRATLANPAIEHVDVVEIDQEVIELVGPLYVDPRLTIHLDDAYTKVWPRGMRWSLAWHDIWDNLCTDNLDEMAKLHRRFGHRVGWQSSWGYDLLKVQRRREKAQGWW